MFKTIRAKNEAFWKRFHDPKTRIARKGKWYSIIPLVIIAVGALLLCIPSVGFNFGLDFTGGSVVSVTGFVDESIREDVRAEVGNIMKDNNLKYNLMNEIDPDNQDLRLSVTYQNKNGTDMTEVFNSIKHLESTFSINVKEAQSISASASSERLLMTVIAVTVSLLAILLYMFFRFKLTSGICAIVGLIHDVLVLLATTVIFQIQVNYSFVAALILVVVYSLNNTLVLFDRIREKEKFNTSKQKVEDLVDASIKETFGRTMGTTITTLVAVIALVAFGVPLIREFSIPILFGLVAGTFSTIFVTTSLYLRFENAKHIKAKYKTKYHKQENLVAPE